MERNSRTKAQEFVMGSLVDVLKAAPSADIVNKNCFVIGFTIDDIRQKLTEPDSVLCSNSGFTGVGISPDNNETMSWRSRSPSLFLRASRFLCVQLVRTARHDLILVPSRESGRQARHVRYPNDVTIVGRVTAISMRIADAG
jgi:hypothetical protein